MKEKSEEKIILVRQLINYEVRKNKFNYKIESKISAFFGQFLLRAQIFSFEKVEKFIVISG
jgi:hypothetical protein